MDDPDECISAAIIFAAMTAGSAVAAAIRCQDAPGRPQDGVYWSGREIEGKRCWFDQHEDPGKRGLAPDPGLLNCNCKSLRSRPERRPEAFKEAALLASDYVRNGLMPELEEREKLEEIAEGIQLAKDTAEGAVAINVAMKSR